MPRKKKDPAAPVAPKPARKQRAPKPAVPAVGDTYTIGDDPTVHTVAAVLEIKAAPEPGTLAGLKPTPAETPAAFGIGARRAPHAEPQEG